MNSQELDRYNRYCFLVGFLRGTIDLVEDHLQQHQLLKALEIIKQNKAKYVDMLNELNMEEFAQEINQSRIEECKAEENGT